MKSETVRPDAIPLHQKVPATLPGRHLSLIRDLRHSLSTRHTSRPARILSFGCSTGFECLDLAAEMPEAEIFGCDVNDAVRAEATERCRGKATILESRHSVLQALAPFDAVLALNVFCRYPQTAGLENVSTIYPFTLFDEGVRTLDELVASGGFIVVYNAQYFFEDSSVASRYASIDGFEHRETGWIEKSLPSGERATEVFFRFQDREYPLVEWRQASRTLKSTNDLSSVTHRHAWRLPSASICRTIERPIWRKLK